MARQLVRVDGLRETEQALRELPKAMGKNVLKRVLMRAGEPIEAAAAVQAPELKGHLKRSIDTSTKLSRRQAGQHTKQSAVEVFVGAGPLPQAHLQEFGTADQPPQPFLRPAWDANRTKALDIIKNDLWEEIKKAAARLARKAARAAKSK